MKILKLISLNNLLLAAVVFLNSCGNSNKDLPISRLVIITDESLSVEYKDTVKISKFIYSKFQDAFRGQTSGILLLKGRIGDRQGGLEHDPFEHPYPFNAQSNKSGERKISKWNDLKREWFVRKTHEIAGRVVEGGKERYTDIFSIIRDLEIEKRKLAANEFMNVILLSDMIHDTKDFHLNEIDIGDADRLGREKCLSMKQEGLSDMNMSNVKIYIRFVSESNSYDKIKKFWNAFFDEWGVFSSNYDYVPMELR